MKVRKLRRRGRIEWVLDYYVEGKRRRQWHKSRLRAESAMADLKEQERTAGRVWLALSDEERSDIITVFSEAKKLYLTLRQVWESYQRGTRAEPILRRTLRQAIDETVTSKLTANLRPRYVESLRSYLLNFARGREELPVDRIGVSDVEQWFAGRREGPATRASNLGRLSAMFDLAVRRGYCIANPCERVEKPTLDRRPPTILSVEQAKAALKFTRTRMKRFTPTLALGMFAGVRPEELEKVAWSDVNLKAGHVTIDAATSKVRQRRVVELHPTCIAWLKLKGDLPLPTTARRRCVRRLRKKMKFEKWPQDLLRHTAASYLLALHQDAGKVAMWLGNSPGILLRHYKELVTREQAARFWAILPKAKKAKGKKKGLASLEAGAKKDTITEGQTRSNRR